MIHVIATIEVAPGRREAVLAEFHKIVPLVRAESGCHWGHWATCLIWKGCGFWAACGWSGPA